MALPYEIMAYSLAEKYCGAKPMEWGAKLLGAIQSLGCGPGTEIYSEAEAAISRAEQSDLAGLATDGDETIKFSEREVEAWAAQVVEGFGGCKALVAGRDK